MTSTTWLREDAEQYHATPNAWGSSLAKLALKSPRMAKDKIDGLIPSSESAAFSLGTAWHTMLTGVGKAHIVRPEGIDGRSKEGKAWLAEHAGSLILTNEQAGTLDLMRARIDPIIGRRIEAWKREGNCEVVARINHNGWCEQARPDMACDFAGLIVDLKTTGKPIEEFARSAFSYGYPFQAGWYRRVVRQFMRESNSRRFILLVTETVSPYRTVQMEPDADWLEYGDQQADKAAAIIAQCYETGDWSDQTLVEQSLSLPAWAMKADITENADGGIDLGI